MIRIKNRCDFEFLDSRGNFRSVHNLNLCDRISPMAPWFRREFVEVSDGGHILGMLSEDMPGLQCCLHPDNYSFVGNVRRSVGGELVLIENKDEKD